MFLVSIQELSAVALPLVWSFAKIVENSYMRFQAVSLPFTHRKNRVSSGRPKKLLQNVFSKSDRLERKF
jgi:hypothetical protein